MRSRSGFSFVEVLVALVIVGLMAAAIGPSLLPRMRDGAFAQFQSNVDNIRASSTVFLSDIGAYPGRPTQFFKAPVGGTSKTCSTPRSASAARGHPSEAAFAAVSSRARSIA